MASYPWTVASLFCETTTKKNCEHEKKVWWCWLEKRRFFVFVSLAPPHQWILNSSGWGFRFKAVVQFVTLLCTGNFHRVFGNWEKIVFNNELMKMNRCNFGWECDLFLTLLMSFQWDYFVVFSGRFMDELGESWRVFGKFML